MRVMPAGLLNAIAWLFLAVVWGTTWSVVTVGLRDLEPFFFAGTRFLLAGLILFATWPLLGTRAPSGRHQWVTVVVPGLLIFAFAYALQFWGQQFTASGVPAIVFATVPLLTMITGHFVIAEERLTAARVMGAVLGVAGVGVIFADQLLGGSGSALLGVLGFFLGALAIAVAQVMIKARGAEIQPVAMAAPQMVIGGVILLIISLTIEPLPERISMVSIGAIAYLGLMGSAVAFQMFYWLMKRMSVSRVSSMMLVHPVVAVIIGSVFLDEVLGVRVLAGGAMVLAGLALVLRLPAARPSAPNLES